MEDALSAPLRFLMVCMQFPTGPGESYLTTELADALVAAGHEVEVLLLDWNAPPGRKVESLAARGCVRMVRCPPRQIRGLGRLLESASKFVFSGWGVARAVRRNFDLARFDVLIAWSPAIAVAPLLAMARRAGVRRRLLFIWDFFPDHHREIDRVPGGPAFWIARAWEQRLMSEFSAIICTLPQNADYLRRRFRVGRGQRVLVTPIWADATPSPSADRSAIRARHHLPPDRPIAVFGGQFVEGRGFEQMLGAADAAQAAGSPLLFLFVGDGRLAPMLRERAAACPNIACLPSLPRETYLELLGACDVGMVATTSGVTSFSIPSKTIDYLRAGLPVVAALEPGNELAALLWRYGLGATVAFDQPGRFMREAERLATDAVARAAAREAAPRCLDEVFEVRHAVATVLSAVSSPTPVEARASAARRPR